MQKYEDNLAAPINGNGLQALSGARITVTSKATGLPAALFSDNGVTPITQPLTTDDTGYFTFHAADGTYTLTFSGVRFAAFAREVILEDPQEDPYATLAQLSAGSGSALVVFTQAGAGAQPQPVQEVLRERVSVKQFGAAGNGVADDTAAIQAALDASSAIRFPSGSYRITAPLVLTSSHSIVADKHSATIVADAGFAAGSVTRTYVDSAGATQTLTWNDKAIFYLVCPVNSYLTDIVVDGLTFDLPSDGSVGVFNAQRLAHSSFRNLFCDTSAYFAKGFDLWMVEWANIRSRFSRDHFNINTGTSNRFENVHCDGKFASGGTGFSLTNMEYSTLTACGADAVDRAYYVSGGDVTMSGCGAESFSRILQVVAGANVTINGGSLAVYKATSATGAFTPYAADGANTAVKLVGTWLGIKNTAVAGGTYDKFAITNGAQVTCNARAPVELGAKWWFIADANSALTLADPNSGVMYYNRYGASRRDAGSNIKTFEYTKSIAAGSAVSVFRIANSTYGDTCFGQVRVMFFNYYSPDLGFVGAQSYQFACMKETTAAQNISKGGDATAVSNTGGAALGTITAALVRNGDSTVDFQITIPAAYGTTTVTVLAEYMNYSGGSAAVEAITGL